MDSSKLNVGKLTIFYTNIDVLTKSKLNPLEVRISLMSPHIICTTEILPKNTQSKYSIDTYQLKGYNIITYNFQKRGLCIYARPNLNISVLEFVYNFEECVWCKIINKQDTFVLGCLVMKSMIQSCFQYYQMYYLIIIKTLLYLIISITPI